MRKVAFTLLSLAGVCQASIITAPVTITQNCSVTDGAGVTTPAGCNGPIMQIQFQGVAPTFSVGGGAANLAGSAGFSFNIFDPNPGYATASYSAVSRLDEWIVFRGGTGQESIVLPLQNLGTGYSYPLSVRLDYVLRFA